METDIPAEMQEMVQQYRPKLVEAVAETDEALIESTWKAKNLQKLKSAKVYATTAGTIVPVLCGSAQKQRRPTNVGCSCRLLPHR